MPGRSRRPVAAWSQRGRADLLYRPGVLIRVLGPLRVEAADGTPLAPLRPMERRLLAALAARRPNAVDVDSLADALWPDAPPASAR
jgi:DNA-binding SARP family transcriptional activator